jgi:hypothetical protein
LKIPIGRLALNLPKPTDVGHEKLINLHKMARKQQSLEALQEYRLQELKEAMMQETDPNAIVIHKYTKKVV